MKPEQVERVLAFWPKSLEVGKMQDDTPANLLLRLSRLAPYLKTVR